MRIAIFELHFHVDSLDALIKIFEHTSYEVHVFTTRKNLELLSKVTYDSKVVFHPLTSVSRGFFIWKNRTFLKSCDIIFINTISSSFGSYMLLPKRVTKVLRVHNINKQFAPNRSIYWPGDLLSLWKMASYFGRQVVLKLFPLFRRLVNARTDYFTFPDDGLKQYVLDNHFVEPARIIPSIPLKINSTERDSAVLKDKLNITIIGATDFKRRSYDTVLDALERCSSANLMPIHLTLLGKTSGEFGKKITNRLDRIVNDHFSYTAYEKQVPEDEFIRVMNETHLVISPIIQHARAEIYHEYYGKTKTTGSILDFMKFGIITLTPDYYDPPVEMRSFILKYTDSNDLARHLDTFREDVEQYNAKSRASMEFIRSRFNKEQVFQLADTTFQKIRKSKQA